MKVSSAIVHEGANGILNPRHPAYAQLELTIIRRFTFDDRMFK